MLPESLMPAKLLASVPEEVEEAEAEGLTLAEAEEGAEASGVGDTEEVAEAEAGVLSASAEAEELLDGLGSAEAEALGLAVAEGSGLTGSGSTLPPPESVQPEPTRRSARSINAATESANRVGRLRAVRS